MFRYDTSKPPVYQCLEALERKLAEGKPLPSTEEGFDDLLKELSALEREKNDKASFVEDLLKTLEEVDGLSDVMEPRCFQEERADVGRRWERVKEEVSSRDCSALVVYAAVVTTMYKYHMLCACIVLMCIVCVLCVLHVNVLCVLCECTVYMYCVCVFTCMYCVYSVSVRVFVNRLQASYSTWNVIQKFIHNSLLPEQNYVTLLCVSIFPFNDTLWLFAIDSKASGLVQGCQGQVILVHCPEGTISEVVNCSRERQETPQAGAQEQT